jgi:hypothetical protein
MFRDNRARVETRAGVVRHLPGDEYELVADHGWDKTGSRRRGDPGRVDLVYLVSASGTTAISDVDIVDPPPKQRSITTDVLGGM